MELLIKETTKEKINDKFFDPASIVLIGASRKTDSVGNAILRNILNGYKGKIFPVNKNPGTVLGRTCYTSVSEIEDEIDLAIIAVPRNCVAESLLECAAKRIQNIVIITAGFKEIGEAGLEYENEIKKIINENSLTVIGPNCLGIINTEIGLNATFASKAPKKGNISFISQSGAVGVYALEFSSVNDIGFAKFISIGNKTSVNENDILSYLEHDKLTKVIALYLESFSDPKGFAKIASRITQGENAKPVLLIKAAKSQSGKRAALSHTGALTGSDEMIDDLMEQCGVIRVKDLEELFNFSLYFANQPLPSGPRLGIITNAGGLGIMAADDAERVGLTVPELSKGLQEKLAKNLSANGSFKNPIDLIGDADVSNYRDALDAMIESDEVDSVIVLCTPQMMTKLELVASEVASFGEKAKLNGKPMVASFASFDDNSKINNILFSKNIPNFRFSENAIEAVAGALKFNNCLHKPENCQKKLKTPIEKIAASMHNGVIEDAIYLTEPECYTLLASYGISHPKYKFCATKEDTLSEVKELRYPVVLKIVSHDIIHKFEVGGVILNIQNEAELSRAYDQLMTNAKTHAPNAKIDGVLVQEKVQGGTELIAGVNYHKDWGHILMFGIGGTYVEILKDVKFKLAPITYYDAEDMVTGIRAFKMLSGFRGNDPKDIVALINMLMKISHLVTDYPDISELDFNPVFALKNGCEVADARIIIKKR